MRINRKITYRTLLLYVQLMILLPLVVNVFSVQAAPAIPSSDYKLVTTDNLLKASIVSVAGSGKSVYTLPNGGSFNVEIANPYIKESGIIDYIDNTWIEQTIDEVTGEPVNISYTLYHRRLPFEFDVNVWSAFNYDQVVPKYTIATSGDEATMVVGRIYDGDTLNYEQKSTTYTVNNKAHWDNNDVKSYNGVENFMQYSFTPIEGTNTGTIDYKYGSDGTWKNYDNNQKFLTDRYTEFTVNIPHYKWEHPLYSKGTTTYKDFLASNYQNSKNVIENFTKDTINIGNFDINLNLVIDKADMPNTINFEDGTMTLDGAWVRLSDYKFVGDSKTGYCTETAVVDSKFEQLGEQDSVMNANLDGSKLKSENPSIAIGSYQSTDNTEKNDEMTRSLSSNNLYSYVSYDAKETIVGADFKQAATNLKLQTSDGKSYSQYIAEYGTNSKLNFKNLPVSWNLTLENTRLVPKISLLKQSTNLKYYEYYIDRDVGKDQVTIGKSGSDYKFDTLLGWQVNNVFGYRRIGIDLDVYSIYGEIVVMQGDDNSHLKPPTEPTGKKIWDLSPYGSQNFNYQWEDPSIDALLDQISLDFDAFMQKYQTLVYFIIVIIGLVLVVIIVIKVVPNRRNEPDIPQFKQQTGYVGQQVVVDPELLQLLNDPDVKEIINQFKKQKNG